MEYFDRYKTRMQKSGGSLRAEKIRNSKILLNKTFSDDAAYSSGIYFWELGVTDYTEKNPVEIRLYKRSFSNANGVTIKFQTEIDSPIIVGDVIFDSINEEYFICIESANIGGVNYQGKLLLCNWMLKWQDADGNILVYPCNDINSTQYNSGEQANKVFTQGSSQHLLMLTCDDNTVILNTPKRFYLDKNTVNPTSYIVTQNDTTSYNFSKKGIVRITVVECENNNETDRPDLGICDYFEPDHVEPSDLGEILYDTKVITSGGNKQKYVGILYDDEGNVTEDGVTWNLICDFVDVLDVNIAENYIVIGIDDDNYVDEEFKLVLCNDANEEISSLILKVGSLL